MCVSLIREFEADPAAGQLFKPRPALNELRAQSVPSMQWKALSLLGLCMCAVWVPKAAGQGEVEDEDEYEEEERASLLIRHALLAKEPTQGNNLSVLVEIFNAGSA